MRPIVLVLALSLAIAASAQAPADTLLALEAPVELAQGEAGRLRATLTDGDGQPLAGHTIDFTATLPFFDYVGTTHLGSARTNFRGEASVAFSPTVLGRRTITASFGGTSDRASAVAQERFTVVPGVLAAAPAPTPPVLPWLTRTRATAVLLPAILGVWVIFGYAIYQMTRIAREGRAETPRRIVPPEAAPTP
jgi:hypothetical protein